MIRLFILTVFVGVLAALLGGCGGTAGTAPVSKAESDAHIPGRSAPMAPEGGTPGKTQVPK
jgi:hypothetical protein